MASSSGSGVKPNAAFRHSDVDSPFGRFGVDTSSIALSIFGPDSGFMVYDGVSARANIFSVQGSHRRPTKNKTTCYSFVY
jgi:hypothetical protein